MPRYILVGWLMKLTLFARVLRTESSDCFHYMQSTIRSLRKWILAVPRFFSILVTLLFHQLKKNIVKDVLFSNTIIP